MFVGSTRSGDFGTFLMVIAFVGFFYAWYAQKDIQSDRANDARRAKNGMDDIHQDRGLAFPVQSGLNYYAKPDPYSMRESINNALLWAFPMLFLLGTLLLILGCLGSKQDGSILNAGNISGDGPAKRN